mgnify:CR=1 FL=1
MPRKRMGSRLKRGNLLYSMVLLILATASVFIFAKYGIPYMSSMVFGYEGSKIYLDRVCLEGRCFSVGESKPSGASTWSITPDSWNIDLDAECDGRQNFAGIVDTNGKFEKTAIGTPIVDSVEWTKVYDEGDRIVRKKFRAQVWYFDHVITFMTKVDECLLFGVGTTEKRSPLDNARAGFWVHVENWAPEGNNSAQSFAAVLGVEVIDIKIYRRGKDGQMVEGIGPGMTVHANFHVGQMLALQGRESISGKLYKQHLESEEPDITPDPNLTKDAYFELGFTEFGAAGGGWFDEWYEPVVQVKLRVHVIKVDSWICIQKKSEPPKPPTWGWWDPYQWVQGFSEWFSKTFGIPLSIAGWAILFLFLFLAFCITMILIGAFAARMGMRGSSGE